MSLAGPPSTDDGDPGRPAIPGTVEPKLEDPGGVSTGEGSEILFLGGIWVALFAAAAIWAIASPVGSVPDEPPHAIRAAAVWRGELTGRYVPQPEDLLGEVPTLGIYEVEVPADVADLGDSFRCYAGSPEITADCAEPVEGSRELRPALTAAGSYPPLYYALVGWPTRIWPAPTSLYVMRVLSAALVAALMAVGAFALRRMVSRPVTLCALALAGTPMLYFLGGSVNPNGFEIAAGFALWASAVALLGTWRPGEGVDRPLAAAFVVSAFLFANTRALSPAYAVAILVGAGLVAGGASVLRILRDRRSWVIVTLFVFAVGVASAWVVSSSFVDATAGRRQVVSSADAIQGLVASVDDWAAQMVAVFGWMDVGPVSATVVVWGIGISVFVAFAACFGGARQAVVLMVLIAGMVVAPVVLQYPSARQGVVIWQGRYLLPLAVGIPVVAAVVMRDALPLKSVAPRLLTGLAVLTAWGQVHSHMAAMRRYAVGEDGTLNYLAAPSWDPPLSAGVLLAATVLIWGGWVVATWRTATADARPGALSPQGGDDHPASEPV